MDCKEEVLVVDNNQLPFLCPYHLFFSRHPNHQGKKEIHHLLKPKNVVSAEQTLIMVSPEMSISLCALLDVFICVYVCGGVMHMQMQNSAFGKMWLSVEVLFFLSSYSFLKQQLTFLSKHQL